MASSIRADESDDWSKWKSFNSKKYSDNSADTVRRSIFENNLKRIKQHNAKNSSFKMALNAFSDLSDQELADSYTIKINEKSVKALIRNASVFKPDRREARSPVDSVNWVTAGYVSPIQNQGSCGSCYAFGTTAAVESAYAIKYKLKNAVPVFSAQQILDCSYYRYISNGYIGNQGCSGGNYYFSLYYVYQYGLMLESSYPYVGYTKSCAYSASKKVATISGIWTASQSVGAYNSIKSVVLRQPVQVYMYVTSDFYSYSSGIYTGPNCMSSTTSCPLGVNHAVTIVGYGTDNVSGISYWIVRNQWGRSWGQNGYAYISMGRNTCCIEGYSYFPSI